MHTPDPAFLLGPLLKGVSRSFYLTLRILPAGMREPVGLAYLLARAADTVVDTPLIPPGERLGLLLALRGMVNGALDGSATQHGLTRLATDVSDQQGRPDEKLLLRSLPSVLAALSELGDADHAAVRGTVTTLTTGMEFDLQTFPDEGSGTIGALQSLEELDRYTYLVAGCVGEFWTAMTRAHTRVKLRDGQAAMAARGIRFGKALQMTNVLRDCGKDLRLGRCYLPATLLAPLGLRPQDLLLPDASARARPVLAELVQVALGDFQEAVRYTLAIPASAVRLRLACLWPIGIGLETLLHLARNEHWLDPARASKIRRGRVYRIMAHSLLLAGSDAMLAAWAGRLAQQVSVEL